MRYCDRLGRFGSPGDVSIAIYHHRQEGQEHLESTLDHCGIPSNNDQRERWRLDGGKSE
jgi:hypothetical protein